MKKDGFLYRVLLGVCIAVCVAVVLAGLTALKNKASEWFDEHKGSGAIISESLEKSENINLEGEEE